MKTQLALETEAKIRDYYPRLGEFYQDYMGNFQFTEQELHENLSDIKSWLKEHDTNIAENIWLSR
jgi:hypothetical protein